ncbi:hypothetical protein [Maribacter sp. 2307ULW6-5]|uniref:hypothetical protein n=1 Tax=Maribacter sp. 2307ULW6-5 TaxID=3386275 RepID=UPI0039BC7FB6
MLKFTFGLLVVLSLILTVRIVTILVSDFERLTEYGMGYLVGLCALLLLLLSLSYITGRKVFK